MSARGIFKYPDGVRPNMLAFAYIFVGYAAALVMICLGSVSAGVGGALLLAHVLTLSAYFVHELAHGAIFRRALHARLMGALLLWMNGSVYVPFGKIQKVHLDHHAKRADLLTFDFRAFLGQHRVLRAAIVALEWAFIPAVDLFLHVVAMARPFSRGGSRGERLRTAGLLLTRGAFFAALAWIAPRACALHVVSYLLFLHALRFGDAHQHTYEVHRLTPSGPEPPIPAHDAAYEDAHTFSNLLSSRLPWLNLLLLNFPYHNAHHAKPREPWHRLPALHLALYGESNERVLPAMALLVSYARHRTRRVLSDDFGAVGEGAERGRSFVGAIGVSFLY